MPSVPAIEEQRVEQLAETDVDPAAERDDGREPDAGRGGEIEHRGADGPRLCDQRKTARMRHDGAVRRIEPDVGAHHAERMRTEHADAARLRDGHEILLPAQQLVLAVGGADSTTAAFTPARPLSSSTAGTAA